MQQSHFLESQYLLCLIYSLVQAQMQGIAVSEGLSFEFFSVKFEILNIYHKTLYNNRL